MSKKYCEKCNRLLVNTKPKESNFIIPEGYKNRNEKINLHNSNDLYLKKTEYIKPTRLQYFNSNDDIPDIDDENSNNDNDETHQGKGIITSKEQMLNDKINLNKNLDYRKSRKNKKSKNFKPFFKNLSTQNSLPHEVGGEILLGKFKSIFKSFIGSSIILYASLSIWFIFYSKQHNIKIQGFNNDIFISNLYLAGIVIAIGLFLLFFGIFQYHNFRLYANRYNQEFYNHSVHAQYPPFLREIFIKRIKWRYYMILISALSYTFCLIVIPILYLIQSYKGTDFSIGWWVIGKTPNVKYVIIAFWFFLGFITVMLGINILINEKRHSIISVYTSDNVLNSEEKQKIVKITKKKCWIIYFIFLSIIIIFVVVPLLIFLVKKYRALKVKK